MSDTTNKTPGRVACEAAIQASNELDIPYYPQPTEYWDRVASAVLAHAEQTTKSASEVVDCKPITGSGNPIELAWWCATNAAPKWHPVSEPVPKPGALYHTRERDGNIRIAKLYEYSHHSVSLTHWCGPIEPPLFEEKP